MPVLDTFTKRKLPNKVVLSYIFDYAVIVIFILIFSALDLTEPFHQNFSLKNESLQYPYAVHERIPPVWAAVISCLFPLCCIVFWTMLIDGLYSHHKPPGARRRILGGPGGGVWTMSNRLWEMNCAILGLGLSVAGAIVITGALKNATGKPRPDVIDRCRPQENSANEPVYGLVSSSICTQTDHAILKDGFRSFPSGHSSTAFAGLGFLSFFLAGKLHILDNRGEVWKAILVVIPVLAASLVSVSRVMDARHHPFDVLFGALMGFLVAWASYRQYFPPLSETWKKGRAHPIRSWGTDSAERKQMGLGMYRANESTGGLVADEEEAGKIGVYIPATSEVRGSGPNVGPPPATAGSGGSGGSGSGRFSDESAAIQARKREAQRLASSRQRPEFDYDEFSAQGISSGEEAETFELQPAQQKTYKTSVVARSESQESEDRKWSVSRATTAITGGGAGPAPVPGGGFEPVRRSQTAFESVDASSRGTATPEVKDAQRRVQLVDG